MYMNGMDPRGQKTPEAGPYGKMVPGPPYDWMMPYGGKARYGRMAPYGGRAPYRGKAPYGGMPDRMTPYGPTPDRMPGDQMMPDDDLPDQVTPHPPERPREPMRRPPPPGIDWQAFVSNLERFMKDQVSAARFYQELADMADNPTVKEYIQHAREDEEKHYWLLHEVYRDLTGRTFEATPERVTFQSLTEGLLKATDDELEAFEEYRDEYLRYPDPRLRQLFFELMTDEIEHATRFNTALHILRGAS